MTTWNLWAITIESSHHRVGKSMITSRKVFSYSHTFSPRNQVSMSFYQIHSAPSPGLNECWQVEMGCKLIAGQKQCLVSSFVGWIITGTRGLPGGLALQHLHPAPVNCITSSWWLPTCGNNICTALHRAHSSRKAHSRNLFRTCTAIQHITALHIQHEIALSKCLALQTIHSIAHSIWTALQVSIALHTANSLHCNIFTTQQTTQQDIAQSMSKTLTHIHSIAHWTTGHFAQHCDIFTALHIALDLAHSNAVHCSCEVEHWGGR